MHALTHVSPSHSFSSIQAQDADMVPFIRICKGVVKEASKMYGDCLTWRSTMLPVSRESCLPVLQRGMFFFHGEDKEGRPLGYLTMRGHDPKTRDLDQCLRAIIYQCEALIASKEGKEFQVRVVGVLQIEVLFVCVCCVLCIFTSFFISFLEVEIDAFLCSLLFYELNLFLFFPFCTSFQNLLSS